VLKVCLNGGVTKARHAAVPITPPELAADAVRCRAAGAAAVHLHARDSAGAESLAAGDIAAVLTAVRSAAPGLPVGVSTGAWILPDPQARVRAIEGWTVLPDFASVNAHEDGAEWVASVLHRRGVGIEAGIWTVDAALGYARWRVPCLRLLVEVVTPDTDAGEILARLESGPPILLHGEGANAWALVDDAISRSLDTRVGLEDMNILPDGSPAPDNVSLVVAAIQRGARYQA
jgi:uncharacterized protein (DUF849 family)